MKCVALFVALLASVRAAEVSYGKYGRRVDQTIQVNYTLRQLQHFAHEEREGGMQVIGCEQFSVVQFQCDARGGFLDLSLESSSRLALLW